mmetsp:Transcript_227/g.558  ORF Transcript_227/g.558 Transcript_227/m.558 type:complete len:85 (-) Transcript_227:944-1198(-)
MYECKPAPSDRILSQTFDMCVHRSNSKATTRRNNRIAVRESIVRHGVTRDSELYKSKLDKTGGMNTKGRIYSMVVAFFLRHHMT